MELIVIAKPTFFKQESLMVNQLFEAGLAVFHLRKENADEAAYRDIIEGILPEYHPQIALHHYHALAKDYNINRIHHTESFRKNGGEQELPQNFIFSTSIHQLSAIGAIQQYKYGFFGPVFNSISKPGYQSVIPSGFQLEKKTGQPKIIALGGIGIKEIGVVKEMNFDGVALLGSIWNNLSEALNTFKKAQLECQSYTQNF